MGVFYDRGYKTEGVFYSLRAKTADLIYYVSNSNINNHYDYKMIVKKH